MNKWSDEIQPIHEHKSKLKSMDDFITRVNSFKSNVKKDLIDIENDDEFDNVWKCLISKVNYDKIIDDLNEHFKNIENAKQNKLINSSSNNSSYNNCWQSSFKPYEIDENNNISYKSDDCMLYYLIL